MAIDAGAGAFTFGGTDNLHLLNWVGRPSGAVHTLINNSTNVAALTPWIEFTSGGGATWTMEFGGTGNWECDTYIVDYDGPSRLIRIDGPGKVIWNPVGFLGASGIASPINIKGGKLVLLNPHPRLNTQAITLNGNFTFAMTNPAAAQTLSGIISGTGTLLVNGGRLTFAGTNTYTGATTISNGMLATVQVGGDMNVCGGTLAAGGLGAVGNLQVNGNLNLTSGFTQVTLNTSLAQSNSTIAVFGSINYLGGSLKVVNIGPTLVVGQTFQIFNQSVPAAASMPIVASGYTFANHLAVDGSIAVTTVLPPPPAFKNPTFDGVNIIITATNNTGNTDSFDSTGDFSITNPVGTNHLFFILRVP